MKIHLMDFLKSKEKREELKAAREQQQQKEMEEIQKILKNPEVKLEELSKLPVEELWNLVKKYQKAVELAPTTDAKLKIGMEGLTIVSAAEMKNYDALCNDYSKLLQNRIRTSVSNARSNASSTSRVSVVEKVKENKVACAVTFMSFLALAGVIKSCSKTPSREKESSKAVMNQKVSASDRTMAGVMALMEDPRALDIKWDDPVSEKVLSVLKDFSSGDKGNIPPASRTKRGEAR